MKTVTSMSGGMSAGIVVMAGVLLAGQLAAEQETQTETRRIVVTEDGVREIDQSSVPAGGGAGRKVVRIETIESDRANESAKEVTWLGVSTEEVSEALSSQLGLNSGEGVVVTYVAADSPASKADIQKYDVLVELGDQLLVHPAQLRKLIQAKKAGDTVNLMLFRGGKKQTLTATLAKSPQGFGMWIGEPSLDEDLEREHGAAIDKDIRVQVKKLQGALTRSGLDKQRMEIEIQRSVEQARKALEEAVQNKATLGPEAKELEALARGSLDIEKNATVVIKKDGSSVQTIVKTDDTGSYVIVASPKKHLTAHDRDGKLIFDGEIETQEQQQKVPAEVWDRVKPMLLQLRPAESGEAEPQAQSSVEKKT